ncbi:MAG: hypothetical protein J6V93_05225 [Clostridia bacterium]|nr:hypothetical protein [Clostridia bacterium]
MKSANDILTRVGTIKPNTLVDYLTDYLIAIELRVQKDLLNIKDPVYNASSLSLDSPEDTIYELYLFAVIDFLNGEFGRYENTLSAFTSAWEALVANYEQKDNAFTDSDSSGNENDNGIYDRRFKLW